MGAIDNPQNREEYLAFAVIALAECIDVLARDTVHIIGVGTATQITSVADKARRIVEVGYGLP